MHENTTNSEQFLEEIEKQEQDINDACKQLVDALKNIGGIDGDLIEEIQRNVKKCLETREPSEQEKAARKIVEACNKKASPESHGLLEEINNFCEKFRANIEWVTNVDALINLLKDLIKRNKLKINPNQTWKEILLDCLDYEIKILNLWNNSDKCKLTLKKGWINSEDIIYETNKEGMKNISSHCSEWRKVATQKDIEKILNTLIANYSLKAGKKWDIHDEEIAFFMLMTQSDGEFLLKKDKLLGKDRVLKMYPKFRWFRDMMDNWTGQIILIRKK